MANTRGPKPDPRFDNIKVTISDKPRDGLPTDTASQGRWLLSQFAHNAGYYGDNREYIESVRRRALELDTRRTGGNI